MNIVGFVYGISIVDDESVWHSLSVDSNTGEEIAESTVYITDPCKHLSKFLIERATRTGVSGKDPDSVTPFRIISLAEIKLRYIACKDTLDEKIKAGKAKFVQFKTWDQLKDLINQIETIAEHDKIEDRDLYLIFYFD